jgi:Right handed beta helix region
VSPFDRPTRAVLATAVGGWLALLPATAHPAEEHTAPLACSTTVQALVDAAAPGATVTVPPCVYRETVTINKPITLVGAPGAEIRGSDVWSDWTAADGLWRSDQRVPDFPVHGQCLPGTHRCSEAEQVFVDGARLGLSSGGRPSGGQFALDSNRHVLLADDPRHDTVEVTTRTAWIIAQADAVTVKNFTMRHAANTAQAGAVWTGNRSNWTIVHNVLTDAHGTVVSLGSGNNIRLIDNDIARGGQLGVGAGNGAGNLIQGNRIHHNNIDGFDPQWEAGGLKAALTVDSIWEGNDVYANNGPGLWCDINCRGLTVSRNRVHDNVLAPGILFEVSDAARIFDNTVWSNGLGLGWGWGGGIVLSTSANVEVYDNVVAWNQSGISVIRQRRADQPSSGAVNNYVHHNTIIMDEAPESLSLAWLDDSGGALFDPASNNRGASNAYWYPGPENGFTRFGWHGPLGQLSQLVATPSGSGTYLSDTQQQQVLSANGIRDLSSARRARGGS